MRQDAREENFQPNWVVILRACLLVLKLKYVIRKSLSGHRWGHACCHQNLHVVADYAMHSDDGVYLLMYSEFSAEVSNSSITNKELTAWTTIYRKIQYTYQHVP